MAESLNETDSVDVSGSEENHMQALVSKLDLARKHKQQGNVKFEAKQYRGAIGEYHRAILYLKAIETQPSPLQMLRPSSIESLPPEIVSEVRDLKIACYNNLAVCILNNEKPNYEKIVQYCDLVLKEDNKNMKALYRKGLALYNLKDPAGALEVLKKAKSSPGISADLSAKIQAQIKLCQEAEAHQDQKLKDTYRNMFQRGESVSQQ